MILKMKKETQKALQLLAESINKEDEIISLDKTLYSAVYKVKKLSENKWKVFTPLLIATIAAGVAAAVPDPFEAWEIGITVAGWATLAAVFGEDIKLIIQISRYGKGIQLLNALREDYYLDREATDKIYLKRKKSINASQLDYPPILYISNTLKFDEYDDNRNIAFLTKACASEWKNLRAINLPDNKDFEYCKNGTIFIKHPFFPNTYLELEDALDTHKIMHEKLSCISTIIQYLGATKFSGKAQFVKEETLNIKNNSDISYKVTKLSATVAKDKNDKIQQTLVLNETSSGQFSEENYLKAKKIAEDYGLNNEIDIKTMFQKRDPTNCNVYKSHELNTELTKEINKTLDIAVDLIINNFALKNKYESLIKKRETINITINIDF